MTQPTHTPDGSMGDGDFAGALSVEFEAVSYSVQGSSGSKKLLDSITGYLQPCKVTALMGPSGAGKTTFLDVLAGRTTCGQVSGDIWFGQTAPSAALLQRHVAYVEQVSTLIGNLTVREMLAYTAELKYPLSVPASEKVAAVDRLIEQLGLSSCQHVWVGTQFIKGISGGEAKRTSIAVSLLGDPRLLLIDEITSGLDSHSAAEVVQLVHGLSRSGVTVFCSIHAPSAKAFALFDSVVLLVRGRCVYFGPAGSEALQFAKQHWPLDLQPGNVECSIPEYMLEVCQAADRKGEVQSLVEGFLQSKLAQGQLASLCANKKGVKGNDTLDTQPVCDTKHFCTTSISKGSFTGCSVPNKEFSSSPSASSSLNQAEVMMSDVEQPVLQPMAAIEVFALDNPKARGSEVAASSKKPQLECRGTATPWWWGMLVLLKFRTRANFKNPEWVMARIADKLIFAFLIFSLYFGKGNDFSSGNLVAIQGSLFMWIAMPACGAVGYIPAIIQERTLFQRERANGFYYAGTYFAAKLVEELLLTLLIASIVSATVFYGVRYQGSFALFWLVYTMVLSNGVVLGYLTAAISPSIEVAAVLLPTYVVTLLFFAGQLAVTGDVPWYWRWYTWINFLHYAWAAQSINQFKETDPPVLGGQTTLEYFELQGQNEWVNMSILFAFFVGFTFLAYLALAYFRHTKR